MSKTLVESPTQKLLQLKGLIAPALIQATRKCVQVTNTTELLHILDFARRLDAVTFQTDYSILDLGKPEYNLEGTIIRTVSIPATMNSNVGRAKQEPQEPTEIADLLRYVTFTVDFYKNPEMQPAVEQLKAAQNDSDLINLIRQTSSQSEQAMIRPR